MFQITFLGHQGWHLSSGRTNVLLDPLLMPHFGHDPAGHAFDVFPPRVVKLDECPPIDAVLFSHEHEDHFHIPTIERLDRKIPLFLSSRSSVAASLILQEMGFRPRRLQPGRPFEIGDLILLPLAQASLAGSHPGEWDSLALYVCDRARHGSFFTTVDHRPQARTFEPLRSRGLQPAVLSYADNEQNHGSLFLGAEPSQPGSESLAEELRQLLQRAVPRDYRLEAVLLCANGYAPTGDLAWMNEAVFHRDPQAACELLRAQFADLFAAPEPGETLVLANGHRLPSRPISPWITTLPRPRWPARGGRTIQPPPFAPATGRRCLDADEHRRLPGLLQEFARFLYASPLFQELYLLDSKETAGREPTAAVVLLDGEVDGQPRVGSQWVWDPTACAFRADDHEAPEERFVTGIRCWGTDLVTALEGRMPAGSFTVGRMSGWNTLPRRVSSGLPNLLHTYCHPLRMPERFLELYRGLRDHAAPILRAGNAALRRS